MPVSGRPHRRAFLSANLNALTNEREQWISAVNQFSDSNDPDVLEISNLIHNILDEKQSLLEQVFEHDRDSHHVTSQELHSTVVRKLSNMVDLNKKIVRENMQLQQQYQQSIERVKRIEETNLSNTHLISSLKPLWKNICSKAGVDNDCLNAESMREVRDTMTLPNTSSQSSPELLIQENKELKEMLKSIVVRLKQKLNDHQCPICFDRRIAAMLLPSKLYTCNECADRLLGTSGIDPFTRERISEVVHNALAYIPSPMVVRKTPLARRGIRY
ncbi:hypothetical protein GEMRC1_010006 [Eukaryota sp. GEM-RC1]